jgi:hypothetical protein
MSQKVKIEMTTELADVPKFCSINLQSTIDDLKDVLADLHKLQNKLSTMNSQKIEELNVVLVNLEQARIIFGKSDNRLVDLYSILSGLVQIEQQKTQFVGKETDDVSSPTR